MSIMGIKMRVKMVTIMRIKMVVMGKFVVGISGGGDAVLLRYCRRQES